VDLDLLPELLHLLMDLLLTGPLLLAFLHLHLQPEIVRYLHLQQEIVRNLPLQQEIFRYLHSHTRDILHHFDLQLQHQSRLPVSCQITVHHFQHPKIVAHLHLLLAVTHQHLLLAVVHQRLLVTVAAHHRLVELIHHRHLQCPLKQKLLHRGHHLYNFPEILDSH